MEAAETAQAVHEERPFAPSISAAYSVVHYQAAASSMDYGAAGAAARLWLRPGVEVTLGARGAFGRATRGGGFEAFAAFEMSPRFRLSSSSPFEWRPSTGIEVGGTTVRRDLEGSPYAPDATPLLRDDQPDSLFAMFRACPLRFHVLPRIDLTALRVGFGTGVPSPGRQVRLQLELVEIGVTL